MDLFVHVYIKFVKKYLFFIDTFIRNLWAATNLFTSLFTVAFISRKLSRSPLNVSNSSGLCYKALAVIGYDSIIIFKLRMPL